jgi:dipeptidyl aminopeptidase/acylaminoacyl peptidase
VVACNPRGSSGRGADFLRAVTGEGWGVVDVADIDAAVAGALERHPRLDPDRMGIMGGSYGGFLTAWVIAQQDRWKSAVVERALINWASFAGTSDIGGAFPFMYTRESYPEAWETWWRMSPLAHAHRVSTPTLVLHSENDFRCPIEQAEQYFMALLRNGTTTEMVRFPGEGHELSRSGKPRHRKERFEAILDWHDRHLK